MCLRLWNGTVGISDTPVYERYGERIADGDLPYRDFSLEYPPGALPAFAVTQSWDRDDQRQAAGDAPGE